MSAPRIERWLLIDATEVLADCHGWTGEEIGRAWLSILTAVAIGEAPPADDELTRVLWAGMRARQQVGRRALPAWLRALIFTRDGDVCAYCQTMEGPFEIDHVHPVSRGGSDDPENLSVACEGCNRAKGAKLLTEWLG